VHSEGCDINEGLSSVWRGGVGTRGLLVFSPSASLRSSFVQRHEETGNAAVTSSFDSLVKKPGARGIVGMRARDQKAQEREGGFSLGANLFTKFSIFVFISNIVDFLPALKFLVLSVLLLVRCLILLLCHSSLSTLQPTKFFLCDYLLQSSPNLPHLFSYLVCISAFLLILAADFTDLTRNLSTQGVGWSRCETYAWISTDWTAFF